MVTHKYKDRIVTVCLANRARSPTAEWLLHRNYQVKSCGTAEFDATKGCDKWDMKWATKVLVMEPYQKANLEARFPKETRGKVEVLDVPEVGKYSCQPSLLEEISQRLQEHHLKVRDIRNLTRASNECMNWTSANAERKMRSARTQSYALTDYWSPSQARDVWEEGIVTRPSKELQPWQIEEQAAFERAAQASARRGATFMPMVLADEDKLRVFVGGKELSDEEIDAMMMGSQAPKRQQKEREEREMLEDLRTRPRGKSQGRMMSELKKYAESVKKFFES